MSKPTASAAGGAMPAEGHNTRRAALALIAGAPALAVFPTVVSASTADAGLFELITQWREANDRSRAACRRISAALDEAVAVPVPDVLIKTKIDHDWFETEEPVGDHYFRTDSILKMKRTVQVFVGHFVDLYPLDAMLERFQEIDAAHSAYRAAYHRSREAVGYFELERQEQEAGAEERRLGREVAIMQARTVHGLLAKLSAVADIYGHDDLEQDTKYMAANPRGISLEEAAILVLRDCARMSAIGFEGRA
jgi:hypothetical protein